MKAPDVKKEELQFTGLEDFLRDKPNVTKQEVQDYLANNRVDVQEVTLGGNTAPSQDLLSWMGARSIMTPRNPEGWQELSQKLERYAQQHQKAQGAPETSQRYFTLSEEAGRISEGLDAGGSAAGATKYDKYTLAGGDNYREILLTLPENMSAYDKYTKSLREKYGQGGFANLPYQLNAGEYFDSIANLIQKKSNKYVGIQKGIRLLIYITDDRCNPSLAVEKLLINFLHTQKHNFERIYFFIPILENEGITMQYFPQANPILLSHAEVIQCRQIQITNLVFK
jgi:hypothetical protein